MICFITVTVLWVFSVCLHEFGHALVAYYGGDTTVREKGYLTLNPVRYTHPVYSVAMPLIFLVLGGIGLPGGAVYINDALLRSRGWKTAVALAGPAANVILVFLFSIPLLAGWIDPHQDEVANVSLAFLIELEIGSILLCLLPVPPLDGFRAISPWLNEETERRLQAQSGLFLWGVFIALWYLPSVNGAFWQAVHAISGQLGVDPHAARAGWAAYRFWD